MWTCVNFIIFFSLSSHVNGPIKWSYSHTRDYQNGHTKAQRTTRTEIRTNLSFLVAQKRNRKKLFGCKMSNLATEKTKNGCFRLQFQLKLISATELIFFGFTFSFFRFECIGNRFSAKKKTTNFVNFGSYFGSGSTLLRLDSWQHWHHFECLVNNRGIQPSHTTLFETDCY